MTYRALIIDDSPKSVESLEMKVRSMSHDLLSVNDQESAYRLLETQSFDYALVDIRLKINERDMDPDEEVGFATMRYIHENYPAIKIIAVTAFDEQHETTLRATQCGAHNFWSKNPNRNHEKLQTKILQLFQKSVSGVPKDESQVSTDRNVHRVTGYQEDVSTLMDKVEELIARMAPLDETILLLGEPGTGKEFYAQKIRKLSSRSNKPFDTVNCANLSPTMLMSELFGHKKGSFTNAISNRDGAAKAVEGGTLFLDEIGTIPMECQKQILRFIELKEIKPVGVDHTEIVNVRIIAATNQDLKVSVENGEFRADLRDRLSGYVIELPPLRERGYTEILRLAQLFYQGYRRRNRKKPGLTDIRVMHGTMQELSRMDYDWSGNVRELKQLIEKTLNVVRGRNIGISDFKNQMTMVRESISTDVPKECRDSGEDNHMKPPVEITDREKNVLDLIQKRGFVKKGQVQEALEVKSTTAWNILKQMTAKGLVRSEGVGRKTRYVV